MLNRIEGSEEEPCPLDVIVDMAAEFPDGLNHDQITSVDMAKLIVGRLAARLSINEIVERVGRSRFPVVLLAYLPHVYGNRINDRRRVACALYRARSDFDAEIITTFADTYFTAAFRERLRVDDIAGAWNIVKLACLGNRALKLKVDPVLRPYVASEPIGLLVSLDCGRRLVQDMHARLMFHKHLPDPLKEQQPKHITYGEHWPAGIAVAQAVGGVDSTEDGKLETLGLQAVAIARYVSKSVIPADTNIDIDDGAAIKVTELG